MDVKSAFNNVSRPILSKRLEELGIEPDQVGWADSFMSDRTGSCCMREKVRGMRVPQGSQLEICDVR